VLGLCAVSDVQQDPLPRLPKGGSWRGTAPTRGGADPWGVSQMEAGDGTRIRSAVTDNFGGG